METTVKTYKKNKAYQKDLQRMQKDGWRLVNMTASRRRGGCLTVYVGKTELIATYERAKR
jgi:hypothetical protein